jgi:hypothetical protein
MSLLVFSPALYDEFKANPARFVGDTIDISNAEDIFSTCFNTALASSYGVTEKQLSNQALEVNSLLTEVRSFLW